MKWKHFPHYWPFVRWFEMPLRPLWRHRNEGQISIGWGNGLLPYGNKPLPQPVLTSPMIALFGFTRPQGVHSLCPGNTIWCGNIELGWHGSGNGFLPDGNKPLHEPMLTKFSSNITCTYLKFHSNLPRCEHRSGSTLAQVMACCLTAPSHYLNQCWLIIRKVLWHSSEGIFIRDTSATIH